MTRNTEPNFERLEAGAALADELARVKGERTIEQLAELAGVSEALYRRWQRGIALPAYDTLRRVTKALDLDACALLGHDHAPPAPQLTIYDVALASDAQTAKDAVDYALALSLAQARVVLRDSTASPLEIAVAAAIEDALDAAIEAIEERAV